MAVLLVAPFVAVWLNWAPSDEQWQPAVATPHVHQARPADASRPWIEPDSTNPPVAVPGRGWRVGDVQERRVAPDALDVSGTTTFPDGAVIAVDATDGTRSWRIGHAIVEHGRFRTRARVPRPLRDRPFTTDVHLESMRVSVTGG